MIPLAAADGGPRRGSASCWSTSTFGETGNASAAEFSLLGAHLDLCRVMRGRLFSLQCGAEMVRGFLAARFVTSMAVAITVLAVVVALVV